MRPRTIPSTARTPNSRHSMKYESARMPGCVSRLITRSSWMAEKSDAKFGSGDPVGCGVRGAPEGAA